MRISGEPGEEDPIFESINGGTILAPVSVAELKQAWSMYYPSALVQKVAPRRTLAEAVGNSEKVTELFMRCIVLTMMTQKGITLTDAIFQEVAETPLGLEQLHRFAER